MPSRSTQASAQVNNGTYPLFAPGSGSSARTRLQTCGESRIIPIFPELRPHLEAVWFAAEPGTEFLINQDRDTNANLRPQLQRIIRRAGLEPWPKLCQNLCSTRETELSADYPIHVVCAWIGNSPRVAQAHDLQVTEADFERAAKTGGTESGALPAKRAAQNPAQPVTATVRQKDTASSKPQSQQGLCHNVANPVQLWRVGKVPPAGLEPATPGLGNRCSIH